MNRLTTKELIAQLKLCDPGAFVLIEDGYNLRYAVRIEQEEAISLSDDEVDLLSSYLDLPHMEAEYDLQANETLDFFSIVSICS